jgi:enoyl-CoA hydratase/carnithine racemase
MVGMFRTLLFSLHSNGFARVMIITGVGSAFCAGADLKESAYYTLFQLLPKFSRSHIRWEKKQQLGRTNEQADIIANPYGFGSISRRHTCSKPFIAAVNGSAFGGGVEMILNCDIVVASEDAKFALPEVKRGVIAIQGGTSIQLLSSRCS